MSKTPIDQNVTLYQSALYMTNAVIVETADIVLLVDPCWLPEEVEKLREDVRSRVAGGKRLVLLFTHSDFDHVLGYGAFSDALVIASKKLTGKMKPEQEAILEQIRQFDDDYYLTRDYPIAYPHVDVVITSDGQELVFGETRLTFYLAPGHTEDGSMTIVEPGGIMIAGDYLSDVEFPIIEDSSEEYLRTLDKAEAIVEKHDIRLLVPGHGRATEMRSEMRQRLEASRQYIVGLRSAVRASDEDRIAALIDGCPFPRNQRQAHEANRKQVEKELSKG